MKVWHLLKAIEWQETKNTYAYEDRRCKPQKNFVVKLNIVGMIVYTRVDQPFF